MAPSNLLAVTSDSAPSDKAGKFLLNFALNSSRVTPSYASCAEVTQRSKAPPTVSFLAIKLTVRAGSHAAVAVANALTMAV